MTAAAESDLKYSINLLVMLYCIKLVITFRSCLITQNIVWEYGVKTIIFGVMHELQTGLKLQEALIYTANQHFNHWYELIWWLISLSNNPCKCSRKIKAEATSMTVNPLLQKSITAVICIAELMSFWVQPTVWPGHALLLCLQWWCDLAKIKDRFFFFCCCKNGFRLMFLEHPGTWVVTVHAT